MAFLFNSTGSDRTTTTTKYPDYITKASKKAVGIAGNLSGQRYPTYRGPRVAGLGRNERTAIDFARQNRNQPLSMIESGFNRAADVGGDRWDTHAAKRYMSPFVETSLNPTIRRLNEEAQKNAIGTRSGMAQMGGVGAFGDARTAILEGELEEARMRGIGDTLATGYAAAYDRALGAYGDEQARRLQAADLMGTQGGRYGAVTGSQLSGLMETGGLERAQEQRSLDLAYGDFLEERDWAQRGLDAYIRALSGAPYTQTTTQDIPAPSAAQQATGLGIAGAGLYSAFF